MNKEYPTKEEIEAIKMVVKEYPTKRDILYKTIKFKLKTIFCFHSWNYEYSHYWNDNIRTCKKCGLAELQTTKRWE